MKAIQCDRCRKFATVIPETRDLPLPADGQPSWRRLSATLVLCDACGADFDIFVANQVAVEPGTGGQTAPAIQQPVSADVQPSGGVTRTS